MPVKIWNHPIFSAFLAVWAVVATLAFTVRPETPACVISLAKINTLYVGVDNPAYILVRGVPEEDVRVQASDNLTIQKDGELFYIIRAKEVGEGTITVSGGQLKPVMFKYRILRFPDPTLCLGGQLWPDRIDSGEFKAQGGLAAVMDGSFVCGNCEMVSYKVTQLRQSQVRAEATNTGARYSPVTRRIVDDARPGDKYYFEEVRVKCPGDAAARALKGLEFEIK